MEKIWQTSANPLPNQILVQPRIFIHSFPFQVDCFNWLTKTAQKPANQIATMQCFQLAVALLEAYMLPTLCEQTVGMHSDAKTTAKALKLVQAWPQP